MEMMNVFEGQCQHCPWATKVNDTSIGCMNGSIRELENSCNITIPPTSGVYLFRDEINLIKDLIVKMLTIEILLCAPDYFWEIPGSSTGVGHPPDEAIKGGKIKHTKRAIKMARHLGVMEGLNEIEMDVLTSAMAVHDIYCHGVDNEPTDSVDPSHAKNVRKMTKGYSNGMKFYEDIMLVVEGHMGRWGQNGINSKSNCIKLGHIADYLSSRKDILVKVED